jgi:hypothetical protein
VPEIEQVDQMLADLGQDVDVHADGHLPGGHDDERR